MPGYDEEAEGGVGAEGTTDGGRGGEGGGPSDNEGARTRRNIFKILYAAEGDEVKLEELQQAAEKEVSGGDEETTTPRSGGAEGSEGVGAERMAMPEVAASS